MVPRFSILGPNHPIRAPFISEFLLLHLRFTRFFKSYIYLALSDTRTLPASPRTKMHPLPPIINDDGDASYAVFLPVPGSPAANTLPSKPSHSSPPRTSPPAELEEVATDTSSSWETESSNSMDSSPPPPVEPTYVRSWWWYDDEWYKEFAWHEILSIKIVWLYLVLGSFF